jgi:hypothetical protein
VVRAEAVLLTVAVQAQQQINQVVHHWVVQDLVIEVEIVNIAPQALTYGVVVEVVLELKGLMQDHFLAHHKALQVGLAESTPLMAHRCIGQVVVVVALGTEVVVVMAAMVVVVVVQEVLAVQEVLDLIMVLTDKINPAEPQIP